jgi:hypothetical protein
MTKTVSFTVLLLSLIANYVSGKAENLPNVATIKVLIPSAGEKAYGIAGEIFADLWEKVTGLRPAVYSMESGNMKLPDGDIVVIGSDAVNPAAHNLIRSGAVESLKIQYGGDNYRMLSIIKEGQSFLILAGGSGRSTIYAVYDFFRKQAGVEYFWDGDIIPHRDQIKLTGIDVLEQPRFEYRGLRYFAHRGLHRFQAEHWDLEDWKSEIDWLMKKRFNLFMLRTGIDDLFQRAFPEDVPYPPIDDHDPDAGLRNHFDRTSFWPLKYRGELRKQILQYARDRGLLHPEDVGTITHWYSATPKSFFLNRPDFPLMPTGKKNYSFPIHAIWDIEYQQAWDTYWKLTATHIAEFGGGTPQLFHTIGLAERTFGSDRENLQTKLYVYRKTQQMVREHYPDVPLLVASWDFISWWKNIDVQNLLKEFDPKRTIILDYTADNLTRMTYHDWGLLNNFPWIFGIIHSFANNSDIHGNFTDIISPRLKEASSDNMCVGLVVWSEISHSDNYLLEYLADNSWQPKRLEIEMATEHYCDTRYPAEIADEMNSLWRSFLILSQSHNWGLTGGTVREPQFRILTSTENINLTPERINNLKADLERLNPGLKQATEVLKGLNGLTNKYYENLFWQRDAIDMARTIASSALLASLAKGALQMEAWRDNKADVGDIQKFAVLSQEILTSMSDLLAMSDDFSMYASLKRLSNAKELNRVQPFVNLHAEQTLKGNAEGNYCRSHHYELVKNVYRPELNAYWLWVLKKIKSEDRTEWKRPPDFDEQEKIIVDRFYSTPLADMRPTRMRDNKNMTEILTRLEKQVNRLIGIINN